MMWLIRLMVAALAAAVAMPAGAEWRRAESPNFVVYSEGSEARLRQRILLLEDFDRLLRTLLSGSNEPSPKLHIYFVSNTRELRQVRDVGPNADGFYAATAEGIAAVVSQDSSDRQNDILFHEYAHHFMLQHARSAYPAWFIEGFAEYFMTARFTDERIDIGNFSPGRASWLQNAEWLPWERVLGGTTDGLSAEGGAMYYAQSWLLTHYFFSTPERQALMFRYLAAAREHGPVRAIEIASGMPLDRFGREMRSYIRGGTIAYRRMQRTEAASVPVRIVRLPASADDLMIYAAALRLGVSSSRQAALLQGVRSAAGRHPSEPLARRIRAHAETLYGDRAVAAQLLDGLIAEAPNDVELLYLRGRLHLEAAEDGGDWETESAQARQWLSRAHRNTMNVIMLAHQLAPQVVEMRFNAAALLIARGEVDWAETVLRPLASDPHDRSVAAAAREMIERARGRRAPEGQEGARPTEAADPDA